MKNRTASLALVLALAAAPLAACGDHTEGVATATVTETTTTPPTTPPTTARQSLAIDRAGSSVGFTGAKVTGSHDGTFTDFSGTVELGASIPESSVRVTIQMASVQIEPERLLNHLRSPDFFDVERFPTATFESSAITEGGSGSVGGQPATHTVTGTLALHGQTRAVSFPAIITLAPGEVTARAEFSINRRDFEIVYPGMPDDLIRDEVVIRFSIRAPRS